MTATNTPKHDIKVLNSLIETTLDSADGYREAAEIALHAVELAHSQQLPEPEEILETAIQAVSMLPPASQDLYQRLAALGQKPISPELFQEQGLAQVGRSNGLHRPAHSHDCPSQGHNQTASSTDAQRANGVLHPADRRRAGRDRDRLPGPGSTKP